MANQTQSLAMIQGPYDCSSTKSIWLTSRLAKDYVIVETTYDHCNFITTILECEAAAQYLDLSDTSATISNNKGVGDPPYCYFEGGSLQFNSDGTTNTGGCGDSTYGYGNLFDRCLCKSSICAGSIHTTTAATTTSTETSPTTTSSGTKWCSISFKMFCNQ